MKTIEPICSRYHEETVMRWIILLWDRVRRRRAWHLTPKSRRRHCHLWRLRRAGLRGFKIRPRIPEKLSSNSRRESVLVVKARRPLRSWLRKRKSWRRILLLLMKTRMSITCIGLMVNLHAGAKKDLACWCAEYASWMRKPKMMTTVLVEREIDLLRATRKRPLRIMRNIQRVYLKVWKKFPRSWKSVTKQKTWTRNMKHMVAFQSLSNG